MAEEVSRFNLASCRVYVLALRSVNVKAANAELRGAEQLAAGAAAGGVSLMLVWAMLAVLRFRVFRRLPARLMTDAAGALVAAGAAVLFVVASAASARLRDYRFLAAPRSVLLAGERPGETGAHLHRELRNLPTMMASCRRTYPDELGFTGPADEKQVDAALEAMGDLVHVRAPVIHVVAIVLTVLCAIGILVSVLSGILGVCARSRIDDEPDRTWTAPPPGLAIKTDASEV